MYLTNEDSCGYVSKVWTSFDISQGRHSESCGTRGKFVLSSEAAAHLSQAFCVCFHAYWKEHPSVILKAWCSLPLEYETFLPCVRVPHQVRELSFSLSRGWLRDPTDFWVSARTAKETNPVEVPVHGMLNFFTLKCSLISFMLIKCYPAESCTDGAGKVI